MLVSELTPTSPPPSPFQGALLPTYPTPTTRLPNITTCINVYQQKMFSDSVSKQPSLWICTNLLQNKVSLYWIHANVRHRLRSSVKRTLYAMVAEKFARVE